MLDVGMNVGCSHFVLDCLGGTRGCPELVSCVQCCYGKSWMIISGGNSLIIVFCGIDVLYFSCIKIVVVSVSLG